MRRLLFIFAIALGLAVAGTGPVLGFRSTPLRVLVSAAPDRTAAAALTGSSVVGPVYIFLSGDDKVRSVRYFLDDPGMRKQPRRATRLAPFDLAGRDGRGRARPLDTTTLTGGRHTLTAVVQLPAHRRRILRASFIVPHLVVRADGSDALTCTARGPCSSFDRAYHVAKPGQVVEVAAGTYGNQAVTDDPSKDGAAPAVVLRPEAGASVTINDLKNYASNVRYEGFTVALDGNGQPDIRAGHDIVVQDVHATNFYVQGPTNNVTIKGGEYGPFASCGGGAHIKTATRGGDDPDPAAQPHNTVVDGVFFHDFTVPAECPTAHLDCLHVFYHQAVTIKNSLFVHCAHYGVLFGSNGQGETENDLIQDNFFGPAEIAGFALRGGTDEFFDRVTVRYNSGDYITPQTRQGQLANIKWYANVSGAAPPCRDGIDYQYNIAPDGVCSRTDRRAPTGFMNPARGDYHLAAGAAAIGRGKPGDYPATDYDGQRRPRNGKPDAGADER
jgi:hypothetical protein